MLKYFVTEKGRLTPLTWIMIVVVAFFAVLGIVIAPRLAMRYGLIPKPTVTPTATATFTPTMIPTFTLKPTETTAPTSTPNLTCYFYDVQNPGYVYPDENGLVRIYEKWYQESRLLVSQYTDRWFVGLVERWCEVEGDGKWSLLRNVLVYEEGKGVVYKEGYAPERYVKIIPNTLTPAPVPTATETLVPMPTHTPTTVPSLTPLPGKVFISGVNWIGDRYIALANIGGGPIDISRWTLRIYREVWLDSYQFGSSTSIAANQTLILHFGIGLDNPATGDYYWWQGQLPADYGTVRLFNNYEATVWVYDYGSTPTPTRTSTPLPSATATTVPSATPSWTPLPSNTPQPTVPPTSTVTPTATASTTSTSISISSETPVATVEVTP